MKYKCSVCGGSLRFVIRRRYEEIIDIDENGDVIDRMEDKDRDDNLVEWRCKENVSHPLSDELKKELYDKDFISLIS